MPSHTHTLSFYQLLAIFQVTRSTSFPSNFLPPLILKNVWDNYNFLWTGGHLRPALLGRLCRRDDLKSQPMLL